MDLPIRYPMITSAPVIADMVSVLQTKEEGLPWICNNFNMLVYVKGCDVEPKHYEQSAVAHNKMRLGTFLEHHAHGFNSPFAEIPLFTCNLVNKSLINIMSNTITDFIHNALSDGFYIRIPLNEKHIPEANCENDFVHSVFIYGYNENEDIFSTANFFSRKKYDYHPIKACNIRKSYQKFPEETEYYFNEVILFKFRSPLPEQSISLQKICSDAHNFLSSKESKYMHDDFRQESFEYIYGIDYLIEFRKDILAGIVDVRSAHALYDYMKKQKFTIEFLHNNGYISSCRLHESLACKIKQLESKALDSRNLMLKEHVATDSNQRYLMRAYDNYGQMISQLFEYLSEILYLAN